MSAFFYVFSEVLWVFKFSEVFLSIDQGKKYGLNICLRPIDLILGIVRVLHNLRGLFFLLIAVLLLKKDNLNQIK